MALEPVEFCPLEMIEDTLRTYSAFAQRKGLLLYGCTDARLPQRVFGDPIRIRQILNNLLSNAIKFTDSGRVVLRTRVFDCAEGQVHRNGRSPIPASGCPTRSRPGCSSCSIRCMEAPMRAAPAWACRSADG